MSKRHRKKSEIQNMTNESDLEKVFINAEKGFGVITNKFIPNGTIIVEYKGTFGPKKDNSECVDNGWTFRCCSDLMSSILHMVFPK